MNWSLTFKPAAVEKCAALCLLIVFAWLIMTSQGEHVYYHLLVTTVPASPDGYPRPVIGVYNILPPNKTVHMPFSAPTGIRPFPGPILVAKLGDVMHVRVTNMLDSEALSMHFHGLHMLQNPWMDGVAKITECGIAAGGGSFEYVFQVTQTGTFWYHSHVASQYSEGVLGAIVLSYDSPENDPVMRIYNYSREFVVLLQDWFHEESDMLRVLYRAPRNIYPGFSPQYPWPTTNLLMNGRGRYNCSRIAANDRESCNATFIDPCDFVREQCIIERESFYGACEENDLAEVENTFQCGSGELVRFRVINGAGNAPILFQIDAHNLTIVAKDGVETEPVVVKSVPLAVGQRFDLIVACTVVPGFYSINATVAEAYLPDDAVRPKVLVNGRFLVTETTRDLIIDYPVARVLEQDDDTFEYLLAPLNEKISDGADERVFLWYDVEYNASTGHGLEHWIVNGTRFEMPAESNVLQDVYFSNDAQNHIFKNALHLQRGRRYEFVLFGADDSQQHPWHLHGYTLDFVHVGLVNYSLLPVSSHDACGYPIPDFEAIDWSSYVAWNVTLPMRVLNRGDTFTVPPKSFVVFRFTADNVGPWLCHCHVDWHMHLGMSFLISVEDFTFSATNPYSSIITPPKQFALCGALASVGYKLQLAPLPENEKCPAFVAPLVAVCTVSMIANIVLLACLVLCQRGMCVRRRDGEQQRLLVDSVATP